MPVIEVTLVEGRTETQLRTLYEELTAATVRAIGADRAAVRIIVREVPDTHFVVGGLPIADRNKSA